MDPAVRRLANLRAPSASSSSRRARRSSGDSTAGWTRGRVLAWSLWGGERQGLLLSLGHIAEGEWRATFMGNPMFAPEGFGVAKTPWQAVQRAAWAAIPGCSRAPLVTCYPGSAFHRASDRRSRRRTLWHLA
jgi:hypothetical protein